MERTLIFYNRASADWLNRWIKNLEPALVNRAFTSCRNQRIWDYHQSKDGMSATVEDIQASFYSVRVLWKNEKNDELPDPVRDLRFHCSCGKAKPHLPCAHALATVIYRLSCSGPATDHRSDFEAAAEKARYGALQDEFRKIIAGQEPLYRKFNASQLLQRPDLDQQNAEFCREIIDSFQMD